MEADYTPTALRVMAQTAPGADFQFDILDDGVSILNRTAKLPKGATADDAAEEFPGIGAGTIAEGSLVTLNVSNLGGAYGITIQLELTAD